MILSKDLSGFLATSFMFINSISSKGSPYEVSIDIDNINSTLLDEIKKWRGGIQSSNIKENTAYLSAFDYKINIGAYCGLWPISISDKKLVLAFDWRSTRSL